MFLNPYLTLKTYVVGTQKNRLGETILLSTHNIGFDCVIREILLYKYQFSPSCRDPSVFEKRDVDKIQWIFEENY